MRRPEQALQIALMQWLDVVLPPNAFAFAIPNAARRGIVEGVMMKRMGTRAGVPDVCILYDGRAHFLELKAQKGRLSSKQVGVIDRLAQAGCPTEVVRSIDEAHAALVEWKIPLRTARHDTTKYIDRES